MTDPIFDSEASPPHPHEFSAQLIRQLYDDLDCILFDDHGNAVDESFDLVAHAAESGHARGAVPLILARAALSAHRAMIYGEPAPDEAQADLEAAEALSALIPAARPQLPALRSHAARLTHYVGIAEQSNEAIHVPLSRAIHRFYAALSDEDSASGGRALFELRSMVVHLDACANALDDGSAAPEPLRVIRPDRFHDYFMHYAALAQTPAQDGGEAAVATLTQDGRISAVITQDVHPLESAGRAVREMISGDETTRDHALARIRGLLDFLEKLRRQPQALIGDALNDPTVHLSLVIAAATTPLHASGGFRYTPLAQMARYNQTLLRGAASNSSSKH